MATDVRRWPPTAAELLFGSLQLQAQNILAPSVYIAAIANVVNAALNYLLIFACGLGLRGAPLSTSLSRWVQFGLLCAYLARHRRGRLATTLPPLRVDLGALPSRAILFFRLGVPGALMLGLEAWAFELTTFLASFLGIVSLDAHTILLNIIS